MIYDRDLDVPTVRTCNSRLLKLYLESVSKAVSTEKQLSLSLALIVKFPICVLYLLGNVFVFLQLVLSTEHGA